MAKDLFSAQAKNYAQFRPHYPSELFAYLFSVVANKEKAWDCATGNGQAAIELAKQFALVEATDISEAQLANAVQKENIRYSISPAEQTSFADNSFGLITVAQAYHWFDWDAFHKEATRVGKPNSTIAIWTYNRFTTGNPELDAFFDHFYHDITGPYWDAERRYVDENYETVVFNFSNKQQQAFTTSLQWKREHAMGYLNSWSAAQKYREQHGNSPVDLIASELKALWPDDTIHTATFPIYLITGQVSK